MIKQRICIICKHPLNSHLDDGEYWRCHCLSTDGYQCECRVFKKYYFNLSELDEKIRSNKALKELRGEF